jgi:hypothetical protein
MSKRRIAGPWAAIVLIALGLYMLYQQRGTDGSFGFEQILEGIGSKFGGASVERLFAEQRSNVFVRLEGRVDRVLTDDLDGSRHQRFIVRLPSGHTVLISHNIDLAKRVPLDRGDSVELRGEYDWNDRGGVVHWTHHDPQGKKSGGWIRHAGTEYR